MTSQRTRAGGEAAGGLKASPTAAFEGAYAVGRRSDTYMLYSTRGYAALIKDDWSNVA